jgi:hypothetical protein
VSGVAPLSVFFDATGTTGLTDSGFFFEWCGLYGRYIFLGF